MWVPKKKSKLSYIHVYYKKKELRYNYNKIKTEHHNLENSGPNIEDMILWPSKTNPLLQICYLPQPSLFRKFGSSHGFGIPICYWSLFFTGTECSVLSHCHFWEDTECQVSATFHNHLKRDVVMYIFTHSTQKAEAGEFLKGQSLSAYLIYIRASQTARTSQWENI